LFVWLVVRLVGTVWVTVGCLWLVVYVGFVWFVLLLVAFGFDLFVRLVVYWLLFVGSLGWFVYCLVGWLLVVGSGWFTVCVGYARFWCCWTVICGWWLRLVTVTVVDVPRLRLLLLICWLVWFGYGWLVGFGWVLVWVVPCCWWFGWLILVVDSVTVRWLPVYVVTVCTVVDADGFRLGWLRLVGC